MRREWLPIDYTCKHCGCLLEARERDVHGISLSGVRNLEYRHVSGDRECTIRRQAQAYDNFVASRRYDEARQLERMAQS